MREFVRVFDDCFNRLVVADFECFGNDSCNFAYNLPDFLANGQFLCILTYVPEQTSYCFITGESAGDGQNVVLQERNRGVRNLRGEVTGLTFPQSKILLAVFENHLNRPTHGVNFVCLVKIEVHVSGEHSAPRRSLAAPHIKEAHSHIVN